MILFFAVAAFEVDDRHKPAKTGRKTDLYTLLRSIDLCLSLRVGLTA
jgi:hypothetical protein